MLKYDIQEQISDRGSRAQKQKPTHQNMDQEMSDSQSSGSFQSNFSGTFNRKNQNDSLKMQQRKQNKQNQQQMQQQLQDKQSQFSQSQRQSQQSSQYPSVHQSDAEPQFLDNFKDQNLMQNSQNVQAIIRPPPPLISFNNSGQQSSLKEGNNMPQMISTASNNSKMRPPPMMVTVQSDSDKQKSARNVNSNKNVNGKISNGTEPLPSNKSQAIKIAFNPFIYPSSNTEGNQIIGGMNGKSQNDSQKNNRKNDTILEEEVSYDQSVQQSNRNFQKPLLNDSDQNQDQIFQQKSSVPPKKGALKNGNMPTSTRNKQSEHNQSSRDKTEYNNDLDEGVDYEGASKFLITINVQNHSNFPENIKIPNPNYNILEQAKYMIMQEIKNTQLQEQEASNASNPVNSQTLTPNFKDIQYLLTEDVLSRTIKQIHIGLLKQKEQDHEKAQSDYYKQVMTLQAQVQNLTINSQQNTSTPQDQLKKSIQQHFQKQLGLGQVLDKNTGGIGTNTVLSSLQGTGHLNDSLTQLYDQQKNLTNQEETKRLKEELKELTLKCQFLEQDLSYQAQKTKELQTKYESEIENLRSQLKGSQSEQFIRQQVEHKKLIEDNSVLMREVKILQDQLREEQQKVLELFEDAQTVREEIVNEMTQFERTKKELEKIKKQNIALRRRLGDQNGKIEGSGSIGIGLGANEESFGDGLGFQFDEDGNIIEDMGGEMMGLQNRNKMIQKVSVGLSRPESLLSLQNDFNQKLEELIEQKSKSIVNMITQSQVTQVSNYSPNPQNLLRNYNPQKQGPQNLNDKAAILSSPYSDDSNLYPQKKVKANSKPQALNVVEFSIYESENGGVGNFNYGGLGHSFYKQSMNQSNLDSQANPENHLSSDSSITHQQSRQQQILKSNSSDIQILKHKVMQVRDKHTQMIQESQKQLQSQQMSQSQISQSQNSKNKIIQNPSQSLDNLLGKDDSEQKDKVQNLYGQQLENQIKLNQSNKVLQTQQSNTETIKALNSGLIGQEIEDNLSSYARNNQNRRRDASYKQGSLRDQLDEQDRKALSQMDHHASDNFQYQSLTQQPNYYRDTETQEAQHNIQTAFLQFQSNEKLHSQQRDSQNQMSDGNNKNNFQQQHHSFMMTGQSSGRDSYHPRDHNSNTQEMLQLTQQFKTPVWTSHINQDEDDQDLNDRLENDGGRGSGEGKIFNEEQEPSLLQDNELVYKDQKTKQRNNLLMDEEYEEQNKSNQNQQQRYQNQMHQDTFSKDRQSQQSNKRATNQRFDDDVQQYEEKEILQKRNSNQFNRFSP